MELAGSEIFIIAVVLALMVATVALVVLIVVKVGRRWRGPRR